MKEISVSELKAALDAGDAVLIDVRELDEWNAGHIAQAIHNPMSSFDLAAIPTTGEILFICRSGNRSGQVGNYVEQHDVSAVNIVGGMKAWASAGFEMESATGIPEVI
jgi:rhodanese-related sulfurtransferase